MTGRPQIPRQPLRPRGVAAVAAALAMAGAATPASAASYQARLEPTGNGCALVAPDGVLLFEARGRDARADCLRRAAESGVLRILA